MSQTPTERLAALLDDREFVTRTLSEVTGEPAAAVDARLDAEENEVGINVLEDVKARGIKKGEWSDGLIKFYQETTAFMYETYVWNQFPTKRRMRDWILNFIANDAGFLNNGNKKAKVLTFGDGMGIDTCYLSAAGHDTHYYELSQRSINFARKLSKQAQTPITFLTKEGSIPSAAFDYVVCCDVLEHVPDPPSLVREISSYLKPGGVLLCSAPFYYVCEAAATHLACNKTYSGDLKRLYTPAGLAPVDCAPMWIPIALEKCGEVVPKAEEGVKQKLPKLTPSRPVSFGTKAKIVANGVVLSTGRKVNFVHSAISEAVVSVEARGMRKSRAKKRLADAREIVKRASAASEA